MLNFYEQRFIRIKSGAVALAEPLYQAIKASLDEGRRNIFFLGTGGAAILMMPAVQLLQRRSGFPTFLESSAELVLTGHQALGPSSIVIIPSLSGRTAESVRALEFCKANGAKVFTLVGHADTPLGTKADQSFVNFAEDDTSCESFYLQSLLIALSIMDARGEISDYPAITEQMARLPTLLLEVKRGYETRALRCHLAELGIVAPQRMTGLAELVALMKDDADSRVPPLARRALDPLVSQLDHVQDAVSQIETEIGAWHKANDVSRRLATIPGIGPIIASAIAATMLDPAHFRSGREFAAWLGLVPKQNSSGGKERLGRISRQGNRYVRRLLVIGATAVLRYARAKAPGNGWVRSLLERKPARLVTVALANKMARTAWALLVHKQDDRANDNHGPTAVAAA